MPAVGPEPPPSPDQRIDRACDPNGNALGPARQRPLVAGLDEQMQVVVLNRVADDAKVVPVTPVGTPDGQADGGLDELGAQRPKPCAQRDMDRMGTGVLGPGTMRNGWTTGTPLASCARPLAAPGSWGRQTERELLW